MKILRLTFNNLNSLCGVSTVDFTLPPLANAGLFAITGPTGAGKTTILDAITLALYGRVARYGKDPSPDAVMSRHTGECSAEVEFSCIAGKFRSVWQLQRSRKKPDGKLQPARRRVVSLPGEAIVAETIKEADAKIAELTGLDYDRFLRSVLLAQGEFANFLKAPPRERMELLQEVTGTAIYQDISREAYRVWDAAHRKYEDLCRDHQGVTVLEASARAQYEATLQQHQVRADELSRAFQDLMARIGQAIRWQELNVVGRQLESEQNELAAARHAAVPAMMRLSAHERAAAFATELTSLARLAASEAKEGESLRLLETRLPELARLAQAADLAVRQSLDAVESEENRQQGLRALWQEVAGLDRELATARETLRQISGQHADLEAKRTGLRAALVHESAAMQKATSTHALAVAWLSEHAGDADLPTSYPEIQIALSDWSAHESALADSRRTLDQRRTEEAGLVAAIQVLQKSRVDLSTVLADKQAAGVAAARALAEVGEGRTSTELAQRRDETHQRRIALEKIGEDAARLRSLRIDLAQRGLEVQQTALALETTIATVRTHQQQVAAAGDLLTARRTILTQVEKIQTLENHRAALESEKPCPLCGSTHHPFAVPGINPADDLIAARREVGETEKALELARRQLVETEKTHASLLATQKRAEVEHAKISTEHARLSTEWDIAARRADLKLGFEDEPALAGKTVGARDEAARLQSQFTAIRNAEQVLQIATLAAQKAQADVDRIEVENGKQQALLAQVQGQLNSLTEACRVHDETVTAARLVFTKLASPYGPIPEDRPAVSAMVGTLKKRAAEMTRRKTELQASQGELATQRVKHESAACHAEAAETAMSELLPKLAASRADVDSRVIAREQRFGSQSVEDAQAVAAAALKRLRDQAEVSRLEAGKIRQEHTAASQQKSTHGVTLATLAEERRALLERFLPAIGLAGFSGEAEARSAFLAPTEAAILSAQRKKLDDKSVALQTRSDSLAAGRAELPLTAEADAARLPELQATQLALDGERATKQGLAGELRALLKADDLQRDRQAVVAAAIEAARVEDVRWDRLRLLIGSADGSIFARFAQGLTLERLAVLANRHLQELNPRYSLHRVPDAAGSDLELEIVDHYQADVRRPMRSLSGGEGFLASLALALGLSELASGRTTIESLFIDEGFGSLDVATLETAMAALENLQAGGKIIGVISHVPAMQERISAQIQVVKEPGGRSRITFAS